MFFHLFLLFWFLPRYSFYHKNAFKDYENITRNWKIKINGMLCASWISYWLTPTMAVLIIPSRHQHLIWEGIWNSRSNKGSAEGLNDIQCLVLHCPCLSSASIENQQLLDKYCTFHTHPHTLKGKNVIIIFVKSNLTLKTLH